MYKFGKGSLNKLVGVDERLIVFISQLLTISKYDFTVISGVRTLEEQQRLFAQGRAEKGAISTNCDGIKNKSKHQECKAIDIVLIVDGTETWEEKYYIELINDEKTKELMKTYNVVSGSTFKSIKDYPHFELGD